MLLYFKPFTKRKSQDSYNISKSGTNLFERKETAGSVRSNESVFGLLAKRASPNVSSISKFLEEPFRVSGSEG